ncbi:hypothetical protein BDN67DRAFT_985739 [Paxillus ammoniavirescens]|nr:hypothetical protein BDN67DRAFT_985739 [Paxillus ammoniavirescens]
MGAMGYGLAQWRRACRGWGGPWGMAKGTWMGPWMAAVGYGSAQGGGATGDGAAQGGQPMGNGSFFDRRPTCGWAEKWEPWGMGWPRQGALKGMGLPMGGDPRGISGLWGYHSTCRNLLFDRRPTWGWAEGWEPRGKEAKMGTPGIGPNLEVNIVEMEKNGSMGYTTFSGLCSKKMGTPGIGPNLEVNIVEVLGVWGGLGRRGHREGLDLREMTKGESRGEYGDAD